MEQIKIKSYRMFVVVLFLIGCSSTNKSLQETSCKKCNVDTVAFASKNVANLTYEQMNDFFCTLDESCRNNVEFSETSNEVLFQIFLNKPELSLKSLNDNPSFSLSYILQQLSQPINDGIDLEKVHTNVAQVKKYDEVKGKVLKSLQDATSKK